MTNAYKVSLKKLKWKDYLENLGVDERILEFILEEYGLKM
jgi:hypothetical protein